MTETEARKVLCYAARRAQAEMRKDGASADEHIQKIDAACAVMERAIDIADKHAILAAEHETLKTEHNRAAARIRDLEEEIDVRNQAAYERAR